MDYSLITEVLFKAVPIVRQLSFGEQSPFLNLQGSHNQKEKHQREDNSDLVGKPIHYK